MVSYPKDCSLYCRIRYSVVLCAESVIARLQDRCSPVSGVIFRSNQSYQKKGNCQTKWNRQNFPLWFEVRQLP